MTSSIPPFAAMPRPTPLEVQPCCNTGCDLKDRAIEAAEDFVAVAPIDVSDVKATFLARVRFLALAASLRAYREWRERK